MDVAEVVVVSAALDEVLLAALRLARLAAAGCACCLVSFALVALLLLSILSLLFLRVTKSVIFPCCCCDLLLDELDVSLVRRLVLVTVRARLLAGGELNIMTDKKH